MRDILVSKKLTDSLLLAGNAVEMCRKLMTTLVEQIEELEEKNGYFHRDSEEHFKVGMISELKRVLHYGEYCLQIGELEMAKNCVKNTIRRIREFYPQTELVPKNPLSEYFYRNLDKSFDSFNDYEWFVLISYAMVVANLEIIKGISEYEEFRELSGYKPKNFEFIYRTTFAPLENEQTMEELSRWLEEVTFENVEEKTNKFLYWIETNEISIHYVPLLMKGIVTLNAIWLGEDVEERLRNVLAKHNDSEKSYPELANRIYSEVEQLIKHV